VWRQASLETIHTQNGVQQPGSVSWLVLCGRTVACPFLCTRQPAQIRSEDDFQSHNGKFYSGERKVGGLHPEARGAS